MCWTSRGAILAPPTFLVATPVTAIDLAIRDGFLDDVQDALDAVMAEPFVVETVEDAAAAFERVQAGFAGIAFLLGLVALTAGAFLVANTLAMTLTERTREIGLLRAAGATGPQVRGLVLRQGLALGLVGAALGVPIGLAIGAVLIRSVSDAGAALVTDLRIHLPSLALASRRRLFVARKQRANTVPRLPRRRSTVSLLPSASQRNLRHRPRRR